MADRAVMERVIREAYAARVAGDVDGGMQHFGPNAEFCIAGCPSASAIPCRMAGHGEVRARWSGSSPPSISAISSRWTC